MLESQRLKRIGLQPSFQQKLESKNSIWPKTYSIYDNIRCHPQKTWNPNFPIFGMQSTGLAASFEGFKFKQLSTTIAWRVTELPSSMKKAAQCVISKYKYIVHQHRMC